MPTKKETKTQNTYNQPSMNAFNSLQPNISSTWNDFLKNPGKLQNLFMQQSNNATGQIGNRMNNNLFANARAGGFGGGNLPAFLQAGLARNSRAVGGMQANNFLNSMFQTQNLRLQAASGAQGYRPLQTGQNSTETTSGTGTWLPQVVGAGIGLASSFIPGMGLMGAIGKAGSSVGSAASGWAGSAPWNITPSPSTFSTGNLTNPFGG